MTADTEYTVYTDDPSVRKLGQEGLARSFYQGKYQRPGGCGEDRVCEGDELYNFLSGYQPWMGWAGQRLDDPTTPASRAAKLVKALGSNKDWLWADMNQILHNGGPGHYAYDQGWTKGLWTGRAAQWFGPFTPDKDCRKHVTPLKKIDTGNGTEFWILAAEEVQPYQDFCQ